MAKKSCPKCGTEVASDARFCTRCGQNLGSRSTGVLCPAGLHIIDPTWTECSYCLNQQAASVGSDQKEEVKPVRDRTRYGDDAGPPKRVTKSDPELLKEEVKPSSARDGAKIVGVLVSYTFDAGGRLYPIRAGKNYIGRGKSREGEVCEIHVAEDSKMSDEHALILFRHGRYDLYDQQSTNGTFHNGAIVTQVELKNFARLVMGKSEFLFVSFAEQVANNEPPPRSEAGPR
jgi:hypothetical protein